MRSERELALLTGSRKERHLSWLHRVGREIYFPATSAAFREPALFREAELASSFVGSDSNSCSCIPGNRSVAAPPIAPFAPPPCCLSACGSAAAAVGSIPVCLLGQRIIRVLIFCLLVQSGY